ncbi:uncharacterized protein LOC135845195 [Planococcus citri]|uniref:uncharacterized protein LOC135845195 n=1 Tax=Planococcus citri TaxID=170843 RepID=UPI0031FA31FD
MDYQVLILKTYQTWNSENETADVKNGDHPKEQLHRVVDRINDDVQVANSDNPIPIDDLLQQFENEIEKKDTRKKQEMIGALQRIRRDIYDDSVRRVQVFLGGLWRVVDLGIAGSLQRKRSAQRTEGVFHAFLNLLLALHEWFWSWFSFGKANHEDEDEDEDEDRYVHENPPHHKEEPSDSDHSAEPIKVTTKIGEKGEDHHKIIHKFEIDPFLVKLNMDITCRILDDSKKPHNSSTGGSPDLEKKKVDEHPLKEEDDDWDYTDTEDKVKSDKERPKDSKPPPPGSDSKSKPSPIPPGQSTDAKGKEKDANKSDKGTRPAPDDIDRPQLTRSPSNAGGSDSQPVSGGGDKQKKKFEGNPVDRELLANPPPPGKPLSYSQMKRMIPQKTLPPDDDDDEDIDWGPGYDIQENNPYMPNYKNKNTP